MRPGDRISGGADQGDLWLAADLTLRPDGVEERQRPDCKRVLQLGTNGRVGNTASKSRQRPSRRVHAVI